MDRRRLTLRTVVGAALLSTAGWLAPAGVAATSEPYLSSKVPVADGCIVLGRQWSGVKTFLVQRRLNTSYELDRYGNDTYDAVQAFQRRKGLKVTGRVNPKTWSRMHIDRRFCMDRFTVQPRVDRRPSPDERIEVMIGWARHQVGRRYIWGGAGPVGYDCSGLALQAMHRGGRVLPTVTTYLHQRQDFGTATAIFESGLRRIALSDRRRGDLVFYGPAGSITHMAIYLGHNRVLEAVRPRVQKAGLVHEGVPLKARVVRPFGS